MGASYLGDIALDDLSIYYGDCEGIDYCVFICFCPSGILSLLLCADIFLVKLDDHMNNF